MPKGNHLKQNLPKGVMKVVRKIRLATELAKSQSLHLTLKIFLRLTTVQGYVRKKAFHVAHIGHFRSTLLSHTNPDVIFLWDDDHRCTPISGLFDSHDYTCTFHPSQLFLCFSISEKATRLGALIVKGWASSLRAIL